MFIELLLLEKWNYETTRWQYYGLLKMNYFFNLVFKYVSVYLRVGLNRYRTGYVNIFYKKHTLH